MSKLMWQFKTKNFTVQWRIQKEPLDISMMDHALAAECREKVASGEWQSFSSEIRVIHTKTKMELGCAYLGGSIYEDPSDFRDHVGINERGYGSYFSQMVREAIAEARIRMTEIQQRARQNIVDNQTLLNIKLRDPKLHSIAV